MQTAQRKIVVQTLGKKYIGLIDVPGAGLRTTDLFNSRSIFWKNPNEKCFDDAIQMYDVAITMDGTTSYKHFDKIQIRLPEIIFFYDEYSTLGDQQEVKRATTLSDKAQDGAQHLTVITKARMNSFYEISGKFHGLFKSKASNSFLPLSDIEVFQILKRQETWKKKKISISNFIGVNTSYIESTNFA